MTLRGITAEVIYGRHTTAPPAANDTTKAVRFVPVRVH